jgi:dTDP-4-dehydrorhamnose reductase
MRFLLLGGTGQVGEEFRRLDRPKNIDVVAPPRSELDLSDPQSLARAVAKGPWNAIVNASGYTEVDRAESDEAAAFAVNAEAPRLIATEAARQGIPFVHISTDYVFDGRKGAPYVEADAVNPLNVYGRSKLAGERGVSAANPRHIILRTAWVYSPFRKNFVKTVLRLAGERDRLPIVADQHGCPTAAADIARTCYAIAMRCASDPQRGPYGVYHYAGKGEATWFEFAKAIVELASPRLSRVPQVVPIKTVEYPTPAARPSDTRLDCTAIGRDYGIMLRPWRTALAEAVNQLLSQ